MDKIRRNERMSAMMKILAAKPNRIFTLSYFCDLFGSAKSTMSEDIDILRDVVAHFGLGELETVTGAAGGVRYRTKVRRPEARKFIGDLCQQLVDDFDHLPIHEDMRKPRVGIVGEILVKYMPVANNHLVDLLEEEGAEAVVPDLMDFMNYSVYNGKFKHEYLGKGWTSEASAVLGVKGIRALRRPALKALEKSKRFEPPMHIEQIAELSHMLDIGSQSFDTFRLDYYSTDRGGLPRSPREAAQRNLEICQSFARDFRPGKQNLLLFGAPGLGKTFLSACIARVVSEDGFSVVYDTAGHIFSQFEASKFRRDDVDEPDESVERCMACDLLILDDLGTEMTTAFVQSALYQLLNSRLLAGRSTIISTNLDPDQIGRRYSAQIMSRLEGEFELLPFIGQDIRRLKREQQR